MRLNNINGQYHPSFFNIVLETDENISTAVKKHTSTFVHEFIHYLQDLILPYNIRLNLSKLRWFSNIRESAIKHGRLVRPFSDWDDDSQTTWLQYCMTFGINPEGNQFIDKVRWMGKAESTFESASGFDAQFSMQYREFKVYTYNVPINDNRIHYNLGARDILEYIAYKIEAKHYPPNAPLPQLPYESIDLLFEHYGLSHVAEDVRLCIAECCLYNDNPIRFLFINFLDNEKFKQTIEAYNYDEIYSMLLSLESQATDGIRETLTNKTNRRLEQFANNLTTNYMVFAGIRDWISRVNNFAKSELSGRFIFSDMYKMDTCEFSKFMNFTIDVIGLPLVMNNRKKCISLQSEKIDVSQFIQFYVLQKFMDLALSEPKEKSCPVYDFCKENDGKCDERCISNPQSKIIDSKNCPYIDFLKSYTLSDIEIN